MGHFPPLGQGGEGEEEGFRPSFTRAPSASPNIMVRGWVRVGGDIWPLPCILYLENTCLYLVPFKASLLIKEVSDKFGLGSHQAAEIRVKTVFIDIISRKVNIQDLSLERNLSEFTKSDIKTFWLPSKATWT